MRRFLPTFLGTLGLLLTGAATARPAKADEPTTPDKTTQALLQELLKEVRELRKELDAVRSQPRQVVIAQPAPSSVPILMGPQLHVIPAGPTGAPGTGPVYQKAEAKPIAVGTGQPLGIPVMGFAMPYMFPPLVGSAEMHGPSRAVLSPQRGPNSCMPTVPVPAGPVCGPPRTYMPMPSASRNPDGSVTISPVIVEQFAPYAAEVTGGRGAVIPPDIVSRLPRMSPEEENETYARLADPRVQEFFRVHHDLPAYRHIPPASRLGDYLKASGHGPASIEWQSEGQADLPRFFLQGVTQAPLYAGASEGCAPVLGSDGQFAVIAPQGKFSVVGSSAGNKVFSELESGRANPAHKGFSTDSVLADNQFSVGNIWGQIAGEYYEDPSLGDRAFRLRRASAEYRTEDQRVALVLGRHAIPFGLYNDTEWDKTWVWLDRPIVYGRFCNGAQEATGATLFARLFDRPDQDAFFTVGAYNASEMSGFFKDSALFGGHQVDDHGHYDFGDFTFGARAIVARDFHYCGGAPLVAQLGASLLYGPNGTGSDGDTWMYAAHARLFWLRDVSKTPEGLVWEAEVMRRELHAARNSTQPQDDLRDEGIWTSLVYAFKRRECGRFPACGQWSVGGKYERLTGDGPDVDSSGNFSSRNDDSFRDDRTRVAAFVSWNPFEDCGCFLSHFKFALQYNYDQAEHLSGPEHTFFLGLQIN